MSERVVIIGAGVAGLVANYVAKQHRGVSVCLLEPGKVGGEFLSGGLKYIHRTDEMASMLCDLAVVFTNYTVVGGIYLHGKVEPYPDVLRGMDVERARRIQNDHWRKTRRTEPDPSFSGRSMNDPEATGTRRALRCDAADILQRLASKADIRRESVTAIQPGEVLTASGTAYPYDRLIVTLPLWIAKSIAFFKLPDALAMRLNIVHIEPMKINVNDDPSKPVGSLKDPYAKWDYVYTPYTPDSLIHRIHPHEDGYACEFNGAWPEGDENVGNALTSDLNFLFADGWSIRRVARNLNGHLLPLEKPAEWPSHIQPLGRFAQWDARATADVVLDAAFSMAQTWGWKRWPRD